jgi:hypothetical protein
MACVSTFQSCPIARRAKINTRSRGCSSSVAKGSPPPAFQFQCRASTFAADTSLRLELDENPEAIISGAWPGNCSLLSYDDLRAYLESQETAAQADGQVHFDLAASSVLATIVYISSSSC